MKVNKTGNQYSEIIEKIAQIPEKDNEIITLKQKIKEQEERIKYLETMLNHYNEKGNTVDRITHNQMYGQWGA